MTAAPDHDQSKTAIIVGASRGLGLGLARELARRGWQVTATARSAAAATELVDEVAASDGGIAVRRWTLTGLKASTRSPRVWPDAASASFSSMPASPGPSTNPPTSPPHRRSARSCIRMPSRRSASRGGCCRSLPRWHARLHVLEQGSVADNLEGGMELYRASKAALNSLTLRLPRSPVPDGSPLREHLRRFSGLLARNTRGADGYHMLALVVAVAVVPRSSAKSPGTFAVEWRPRPSGRPLGPRGHDRRELVQ